MCDFEEKWVRTSKNRLSVWFRYIDGTFAMSDDKKSASQFLQYFNSRHNNIKFTIEFEENGEIPLLDIPVKRFHDFHLPKETSTGLYSKWDSFTPHKYKVNLTRTFIHCCFRICSSPTLLQFTLSDLRKLLLQNGYPQGIINYNINDVLGKNETISTALSLPFQRKI